MEIKQAQFVTSMADYGPFTGIGLPQLAVCGKSNVGKSSLINMLCRQKKLARTSATPGKTRLINVFALHTREWDLHLIDLPGYGFAKVEKKEKERWGVMMQRYFEQSGELIHCLCLVDVRHDPTQDDIAMAAFLRQMGIPYTVVATKCDKICRGARQKQLAPICRGMLVQPWEVICTSSEDSTGREDLLNLMAQLKNELDQQPNE